MVVKKQGTLLGGKGPEIMLLSYSNNNKSPHLSFYDSPISELFLHLSTEWRIRREGSTQSKQAGALVFDECLYLQALGVLFFIAGPLAMLERVWASHAHWCKAPQCSEMVTNPGLLSGGARVAATSTAERSHLSEVGREENIQTKKPVLQWFVVEMIDLI